jgi:hypothetical protein
LLGNSFFDFVSKMNVYAGEGISLFSGRLQ